MFPLKKIFILLSLLTLVMSLYSKEPDCELIDYRETCIVSGKKLVVTETKVLQINKRMGDDYATIRIPYSKLNKVSIVNAQIENELGEVIRKLKRSEIKDYSNISDISLYEDDFIKEFELKHNMYPYRIRYITETVLNEFQEIADWYPCIDDEVPTRHASLELQIPLNYRIKYKIFKLPEPRLDTIDNTLVYKFEVNNISLPQKEYYSPPMDRLMPFVRIVPFNFTWIRNGSHSDWKEYGNWLYSIYDGADALPEHEKLQVKKITQGVSDKIEIIKVLYKYMQSKTRYINVSIGVGGLKPYPAEYVSKNGYGDCKALSVYMKALLKEAGITAYYTTIYADDEIPMFMNDFPCHQFNHILNCIPLENDTVFLECTNNTVPSGYLGVSTRGREAFLIDKNRSHIIRTPEFKIQDVKESRKFAFDIRSENNTLHISNTYKGYYFDYFNSLKTDVSLADGENYVREYILRGFPGFELIDWNLNKPHPDSAKITFNAHLKLHNYLKHYGLDLGMPMPGVGLPVFEQPSARKLPLYFKNPIYKEDSIVFNLNNDYTVKLLIDEKIIKSPFGEYILKPTVVGNRIIIFRKLLLYKGEYELSRYPEFFNFISEIYKTDRKLILITKNL